MDNLETDRIWSAGHNMDFWIGRTEPTQSYPPLVLFPPPTHLLLVVVPTFPILEHLLCASPFLHLFAAQWSGQPLVLVWQEVEHAAIDI